MKGMRSEEGEESTGDVKNKRLPWGGVEGWGEKAYNCN